MINVRKQVAFFGTFLLLCQTMLLPIKQVYAETKASLDEKQINPINRLDEDEKTYEAIVKDSVDTIQIISENENPIDDSLSESSEEGNQNEVSSSNDEYENAPNQRDNVSVGDFTSLQTAISNAVANTETIITIINSFDFTFRISIPQDRNIRLQATSPQTLTNSGPFQHFLVTNSQLTLSDNVILDGGGVRVTGNTGLFTLNGGIVQNGRPSDGGSIDISSNAQMIINEGMIKDSENVAIRLWSGTVTMNGGTISGGLRGLSNDPGTTGNFIMNGGTIEGSREIGVRLLGSGTSIIRNGVIRNSRSRGINVGDDANLVIDEGTIIENSGTEGIWISTSGSVVQNGGTIKNSRNNGIHVAQGTFSMNGGSIIENRGGIYVQESGIISLNGGEIKNNHASIGGGVYFEYLTNNQRILSGVDFGGNQADNHYAPPFNVEHAFPNILSRTSSLEEYNHPLNGYDIDFRASNPQIKTLTVTSNLENAGKIFLNNEEYARERKVIGNTNVNIQAKVNDGYQFVRWELVTGVGAQIEDLTESETTFTMGEADTLVRAIYEENQSGEVHVYHVDLDGQELAESEVLEGPVGEAYQTAPQEIEHYQIMEKPENATGVFGEDLIVVTYIYETTSVSPVDPTDPETEVDPENKPDVPENQGLLSLDFASQFNFGTQVISAKDEVYFAQAQRLLNDDGTVNESEERPNYVQVTDRRSEAERNGWQLAVTQNKQFETSAGHELAGARIRLANQQLATVQGGNEPEFQQTNPLVLVPGQRRMLLMAQGDEGTGTWVYRFGDQTTAAESVALEVPRAANPEATTYKTTLTWELSAIPGN